MKRWSTKDLEVVRPPKNGRPGEAILTFTDRYSVYDFGVLPDRIPGKGKASCAMAVKSFELFEAAGMRHHFLEQVTADSIRIELLDIDYAGTKGPTGTGCMIPLQVVYRHALPRESSVHRRVASNRLAAAEVPPYAVGRAPWLSRPMVEFTSKYEETDRFLTRAIATEVGRVTEADLTRLADLAEQVASVLRSHCVAVGLTMVDGKAEFGFDGGRRPILIDHAGTPDENRFYFNDVPVCKELLRYLHPGLREQVQRDIASGLPRERWQPPPRLSAELVAATAAVYDALAATWCGTQSPGLATAVETFLAGVGSDLSDRTGL